MLILQRKLGQKIMIEGGIEITLLEIRDRKSVRIGIVAPKTVTVHREEVAKRIEQSRLSIAGTITVTE